MFSVSCKTTVSDTALAVWIKCWAWPYIWIQMIHQRTFPSRILHFLWWSYQVQAEFHHLVKLWRHPPEVLRQWLSGGQQCRPKHMYPQKQVYPLKSLNSLSSYSSCTCFPFPLAVTYFGILPKRCILEINSKVAGLASFKMYPSEHTCLLLI